MTLGHLFTGVIFVATGIILYYYLLPETEDAIQKQKINIKFLFRSTGSLFRSTGSIFILLGLVQLLTFCLDIDVVNYTLEEADIMNFLNWFAIVLCAFSLERNITCDLRKLKKYRQSKKATKNE